MRRELHVLFAGVRDDYTDSAYQIIQNAGYDVIPGYTDNLEEIMDLSHKYYWDILIIMCGEKGISPDMHSLLLPSTEIPIPWIVITSKAKGAEIVELLSIGCRDVIKTDEIERLEYVVYRLLKDADEDIRNSAVLDKLIDEKEKLALTIGSIGDGVISVDTEELIVMMNGSAEAITGWTSDIAVKMPFTEIFKLVDKSTGEPLDNLLASAMGTGEKMGLKRDTMLITRSGDFKYVSASISPTMVRGSCTGAVIVFREITRIRQFEDYLITEQRNLTMIFDTAPIGMLLVDENEVIKKLNKSMLHIIGRDERDVIGRKIGEGLGCINACKGDKCCGHYDGCLKCDLRKILIKINDARNTMFGTETHFVLMDNESEKGLYLKINAVVLMIDNKEHVLLVFDDITVEKKVEIELEKSRDYYLTLFENFPALIWRSGIDAKCNYFNKGWLDFTGRSMEQEMDDGWVQGVHSEDLDSCINTYMKSFGLQEAFNMEYRLMRHDGEYRWIEDIGRPFYDLSGEFSGYIGVCFDITDRKNIQKEMERAREFAEAASIAKSEFLANMSHEIRTPLNGMLGMIDLTLFSGLTNEQKDNLLIAKDCASTLLNLINDILDFSKVEAGKLSFENIGFDLIELIEQAIKPHKLKARGKGLELRYRLDHKLPRAVNGDPNRLKQVIDNLLCNAIKFTDMGMINLSANMVKSSAEYDELEFQISDTGIGIDSKDTGRIFDTFSQADSSITRRYGGSGLGLAISRQLVEMMGGMIWVESELGKGSSFHFTVKLAKGSVKSGTTHNVESFARTQQPLNILLVEDDKVNQMVMTRLLKEAGHIAETADNGISALQILDKKKIDLVLMDIQMPEMDGIETVKRIRMHEGKTGLHMPVIALTAYALQGDREKFLSVGMDDYIAKPVKINSFLETIEKMAERAKAEKWNEAFKWNGYNYNYKDQRDKDLLYDRLKNMDETLSNISAYFDLLKDAIEKADISLAEKYAHELKLLSSKISAAALKSAIFKVELAARRENITEAYKCYNLAVNEFDRLKCTVNN